MNRAAEKRFKERIVLVCVLAGKSQREARKIASRAFKRWKENSKLDGAG